MCGDARWTTENGHAVKFRVALVAIQSEVIDGVSVRRKREPDVFGCYWASDSHICWRSDTPDPETVTFGVFHHVSDIFAIRRDGRVRDLARRRQSRNIHFVEGHANGRLCSLWPNNEPVDTEDSRGSDDEQQGKSPPAQPWPRARCRN